MRVFRLLSSVALGLAMTAPAGTAEPELSLTLSCAHDSVKSGFEVRLRILLTNLTDRQIQIGRIYATDGPDFEYLFDLHDSQGHSVPLTRYGRALSGNPDPGDDRNDCGDCSGFPQDIEPHASAADEILISKLYDLTRPGKYTIQVSRQQGDVSHMIVKSNTITITITQ